MGTSISNCDGATAYFLFAHSPFAMVLFALGVLMICVGLITLIKRHEDKAFSNHTKITASKNRSTLP